MTGTRKAGWARLSDGSWGVRVEGPDANKFAGKKIPVTKKDGTSQDVTLGDLVQSWKGNTFATYMVMRKARKGTPPPQRPRGQITVSLADLNTMMQQGSVTVSGVTLVWAAA